MQTKLAKARLSQEGDSEEVKHGWGLVRRTVSVHDQHHHPHHHDHHHDGNGKHATVTMLPPVHHAGGASLTSSVTASARLKSSPSASPMLHYSSIGSRDAPSAAGAAAAATGGGSSGNELLLPKSMQTPRGKHAHSVLEYSSTHHEGMATSSSSASIGMGKGTGSDGTSSFTGGSIGSSTASASSTTEKRRQSFDLPSALGGGGVVGAAALSLSLSHTQGKTPSLAIDRALQQASSGCAAVQAAEAEASVAAAAALEIEVDDPAAAAAAARHQQRQSGRVSVSGLVAERLGG